MTGFCNLLLLGLLCAGGITATGCAQSSDAGDSVQGVVARPDTVGVVRADTVELVVLRLDQQTGEALVSNGIPLRPGTLKPGFTRNVRLVVGGEEQALFISELAGRHQDGSVRSVLVQFRYSLTPSAKVPATLILGPSVARSKADLPGVKPAYTYAAPTPQAIALPRSPSYLMATELVAPTLPPEPAFDLRYEQSFATQSDLRWTWFKGVYGRSLDLDQAITANYYDRAMFHWAWWVRTGNPEYWKRAVYYLMGFRELYLKPSNYQTQPHNWQMEGLTLHYLLTGDEENRTGIHRHATDARETWLAQIGDPKGQYNEGRIQERVVQALLAAQQVGLADQNYATSLRTALGRILDTQQPNGSYLFSTWCGGSSNFMSALVNDILIRYYETFEEDPRIPGAVQRSADWLWFSQWQSADGGFNYESVKCHDAGPVAAPDLNMLFVNAYGWLYNRTGDAAYRQRGDLIFKEAVDRAWMGGSAQQADKQYNQQYRSSFRYPFYRR